MRKSRRSIGHVISLQLLHQIRMGRRSLLRNVGLAIGVCLLAVACTTTARPDAVPPINDSNVLTIWWDKGFTLEEDEALQQVVQDWQQQSGKQAELSFYTTDELPQKAKRALEAGNPPDILMSHNAERVLNPRLAWDGQLADVSDVIEPNRDLYPADVLDGANLYNNVERKRSYYAVPIHQAPIFIFYWRDLLAQVGQSDRAIPREWDAFWAFWQQIQEKLPQQDPKIYGLGLVTSSKAGDTYQTFEQILEAYNVPILDAEGQLQVADASVRQGIIDCLTWYTQFYRDGYVPPDALLWLNPDNNDALLNRQVVMTPNNSLSIPAAVRADTEVYRNQLGTIAFPNKPNGEPMPNLVIVRQAVVFTESKHQDLAKEFLSYLIRPEVSADYLKASGGRNLPVLKTAWQDPFWTDPADPHISTATKPLIDGQTRLFHTAKNPAYSLVLDENLWGKAMARMLVEGASAEQAADEAIDRIQQIFEQWK